MSSTDYSDDFEDYTDDFEAYESDQGEESDHLQHSTAKPRHAHVVAPSPLPRPLSPAKPTTAHLRGGLVGAAPPSFSHGVRAPTGFGLGTIAGSARPASAALRAQQAAMESARVKAIRKLVTFEYVNFTLLDMAPKSRYELALLASARVDGSGNRFAQKETQTGSDMIEVALDTDGITMVDAASQCPDEVAIVVPSTKGSEKKDKKKSSSKRANSGLEWTPQLSRFVMSASQVFDALLSMSAVSDTVADEVHDPHAGLTEAVMVPVPKDQALTALHMPAYHPHLLAYAVSSTQPNATRSTIHIASIKSLTSSSQSHILTCWGTISTLLVAPHPRWLVLAGTTDGALLAWDLRKSPASKRAGALDPTWASYSLLMVQLSSDDRGENQSVPDPIHSGPIVAIHTLTDRSIVTVDELGKAAVWGVSLPSSSSSLGTTATVSLVPVTSPTAISVLPSPRIGSRQHQATRGTLDAVPYPLVTALDPVPASSPLLPSTRSAGLLVATGAGTVVRAPADLLVMGTGGPDAYVLPKSAGTATCMAIVAHAWVVVGTSGGQVVVFDVSRGAIPEAVWHVGGSSVEGEAAHMPSAVVGLYFPRAHEHMGEESQGSFTKIVALTQRAVVAWRTEPGKWGMENVMHVSRPAVGKEAADRMVQMAAGKMAAWEPERGAVVVYNLPIA